MKPNHHPCIFARRAVVAVALCALSIAPQARAEDDAQTTPSAAGPWISAVIWTDDATLMATQSQGLLLRPGAVVKASAAAVDTFETIGESEASLWSIANFGDGRVLASDYKGNLLVFGSGEPRKLDISSRWIRVLRQAPGGEQCLAGTEDGKLIAIQVADGAERQRVDAATATIFDIAFDPSGEQCAVACGDGSIKLYSWPALQSQGQLARGKEALWSVVYSHDGKQLISGGADRRLQLWDVATQQSQLTLTKTSDWVTSLVLLPGSTLVAAGCLDGSVVVADYQRLIPVARTELASSGIWALALSPDGQTLAAGTRKHGIVTRGLGDWKTSADQAVAALVDELPPKPE